MHHSNIRFSFYDMVLFILCFSHDNVMLKDVKMGVYGSKYFLYKNTHVKKDIPHGSKSYHLVVWYADAYITHGAYHML